MNFFCDMNFSIVMNFFLSLGSVVISEESLKMKQVEVLHYRNTNQKYSLQM